MSAPARPAIRPRTGLSEPETTDPTPEEPPAPATSGPLDIREALERAVVGQRPALRELSLLFALHLSQPDGAGAPNALVIGPTGVGKTHAISAACTASGLPFVATDATSLVPSGIVGEQVEDVLASLVEAADAILHARGGRRRRDDDLELARRGIIFVDELDKLAAPDDGSRASSVAEKRVIQKRLLKLAEGSRLRVGPKRHAAEGEDRYIDTAGIRLIAGGAFADLAPTRVRPSAGTGMDGRSAIATTSVPGGRPAITSADIIAAGFMPELVARLPVLILFEPLSRADLVEILDHDAVSPLAPWRTYLDRALDASLVLDDAAKWVVAERAASLGMGARGLQQILFPLLVARSGDLVRASGRQAVELRAADLLADDVAVPGATVIQ